MDSPVAIRVVRQPKPLTRNDLVKYADSLPKGTFAVFPDPFFVGMLGRIRSSRKDHTEAIGLAINEHAGIAWVVRYGRDMSRSSLHIVARDNGSVRASIVEGFLSGGQKMVRLRFMGLNVAVANSEHTLNFVANDVCVIANPQIPLRKIESQCGTPSVVVIPTIDAGTPYHAHSGEQWLDFTSTVYKGHYEYEVAGRRFSVDHIDY